MDTMDRGMFALDGPYGFCSNFDPTPFHVPFLGVVVRSAEHAFNAAKTTDVIHRGQVLIAPTPSKAKARGRHVRLRPGWDEGLRVLVMQKVLVAKFDVPRLRDSLDETGTTSLVETNSWHDNFWGDCTCGRNACSDPGKNMLGELLMAVRARGWEL